MRDDEADESERCKSTSSSRINPRRHSLPQALDDREDVVPAASIESDNVVAEFVENLVHLDCAENSLDQNSALDRALRDINQVLSLLQGQRFTKHEWVRRARSYQNTALFLLEETNLRGPEHIIPKTGLLVRLELREVEVRACALAEACLAVVEKEERKIKERT